MIKLEGVTKAYQLGKVEVPVLHGVDLTIDDGEMVANNISSLLQRVSGTSVQEIDRLIGELQTLRDTLQNEGERVRREVIQYANLSQAAMQSTKIIAESLTNCKGAAQS